MLGAETDIVTPPVKPERGGEAATGDCAAAEGNGWRILAGDVGVEGDTPLALLSLRPRYWCIFSCRVVLIGWMLVGDILLKSSADRDHPLRDMLRKSPRSFEFVGG